ncbi:MAG: MFS transporter [Candidatus Rokubacteria bacterium]|nr:MFS transporter [Candidatus Rokubacteria bacterium]
MTRPFNGWFIVAAAFLVLFLAYGTQYAFGVFFSALLEEFGWSRASLAGAFSLYAFAYCLFGFPAGRLTDRWGPRPVIAFGGLFLGAALAGMALVTELWQPYVLYGLVAALGMGTAYVPCNTTVVRWFVRRRGLAVGIASSGGSAGTFALPPLAQLLVTAAGWRAAYLLFGLGIFVFVNLVARVMRRDPESMGLHPDGASEPPSPETAGGPVWTLGRAMRTGAFWMLGATFTATWIPVFVPLVHIVPFARDLGFSPLVAASVVSALGIGAVVGRLLMGGVSDRIGRKPAIAACMALQALTFLGFLGARDLRVLYTNTLLFGYSYGGISTLFPAIVGDFFGRERAGALVGFLFALAGSMAAWGPFGAGAIYDARGGYGLAFVLATALNVLALGLLAFARPPRAGLA